jgi:hypothetical protein
MAKTVVVKAIEMDRQELFILVLMDEARIFETSEPLTESKLRRRLRETYDEADRVIDQRINLARQEQAREDLSASQRMG